MTRALLTVATALCLSACATHSPRVAPPESDLDTLRTNVDRDLQHTKLPNGREYCAELATTERAQDLCMGDLEDALYASNRDKDRARSTLHKGIDRLKAARITCPWWSFACRSRRAALQNPPAPP